MVGEEAVGVGALGESADAAGGVVGLQALYCLDEVHCCGEGGLFVGLCVADQDSV